MKFTNIFTGWPGCVHDARVLRNFVLCTEAEAGHLVLRDHYILADSAYPLRNWLITPFKNLGHLTPRQVGLNEMYLQYLDNVTCISWEKQDIA